MADKPSPSGNRATASKAPQPMELKQIGKYEIIRKIGAGGMGAVYLALDSQLKRQVALKVLPEDKAQNPILVKRFLQEARSAATLKHENIVMIYEAGEAEGLHYIALEFVDGTDVANLVQKRGTVPVKRAMDIVKQVTRALDNAYSLGIVHRDIKPANLLIRRDGVVKLTDLGLARALDDTVDTNITRAGTTVGTVDYMSPEQAVNSKKADVRSDIYSLGCTLYQMLTGDPPFPEGSLTFKLNAHAKAPIPDPRVKNPNVPDGVVAVINRMMAKSPEQRYQTPKELLAELDNPGLNQKSLYDELIKEGDSAIVTINRSSRSAGRKDEEPSDSDDETQTERGPPKRKKAGAAADDEPGDGRRRMPQRDKGNAEKPEPEERDYTKVFWSGMAVLFLALCVGVVWVVKQFSTSIDFGGDVAGDPAKTDPAKANDVKRPRDQGADGNGSGKPVKVGGNFGQQLVSRPGDKVLPAWVYETRRTPELPKMVVRPGAVNGNGVYGTLSAALAAVESPGANIQLWGRGPFGLPPVLLEGKGRIVIQSQAEVAPERQPVIVCQLSEKTSDVWIDLRGTALELEGVHLAAGGSAEFPATLISLDAGDLRVSHCSVTTTGAAERDQTAIQVNGQLSGAAGQLSDVGRQPPGQVRVLLENTVFRGGRLSTLSSSSQQSEIVFRHCLAYSGQAPSIRLPGPPEVRQDAGRTLKLFATSLSSQKSAFFWGGNVKTPLSTSIALLDCAVTAQSGSTEATFVSLDGWDGQPARDALKQSLQFDAQNSLLCGWDRMVASPAGLSLATFADWTALSKKAQMRDCQVLAAGWPMKAPIEFAAADLNPYISPPAAGLKTSTGKPVGPTTDLVVVSLERLSEAQAMASRQPAPSAVRPAPAQRVSIDASRDDVGKAIAAQKLVNGTEIVVRGFGLRISSPILIQGVSVRLLFEQTAGAPFQLGMRPSAKADDGDDALINVVDGSLLLANANLTTTPTDGKIPQWLVQVQNGDLQIQNCRLHTPLNTGTRSKGIIRWLRGSGSPFPRDFPGDRDACLLVSDSYLSGAGTIFETDLRRRAVFIQNSILVSRTKIFDVNLAIHGAPVGADEAGQIAGSLDLTNVTLSTTGTFISVEPAELTAPAALPAEFFADRCVFAPPLKTAPLARPELLSISPSALAQRQVVWWEQKTGYAPDLKVWIRNPKDDMPADQSFAEVWQKQWGSAIVQPLPPGGIILKAPYPEERTKLEPKSFTLEPKCKGATWDQNQPIGVNLARLRLLDLASPGKAISPMGF